MSHSTSGTLNSPSVTYTRPLLTALAMFSLFLAAMDSTAVGTLLPYIKGQLHDDALYPWLMSGFILASVLATPLAGRLSDAIGEKRAMIAALTLFMAGSLCIWRAPDMISLVWSRALQGVGAGAITVTTYVIIGRLYSDQERGKMQGMLSLVWGLAAIAGPLAGALIHQYAGWRMVFFLNMPLCILIMALISLMYPAHHPRAANPSGKLDLLSLISFGGLLAGTLLLIMAPSLQLADASRNGLIGATVICLGMQIWRIHGDADRSMLPMPFLCQRRYLAPALLTLLASTILYASVTLLPLYLNGNQQTGSIQGGLLVMAAALGWVAGSAVCGGMTARRGFRMTGIIGACLLLGGTVVLNLLPTQVNSWTYALPQILIGLGIGFAATTTLVLVQGQAPFTRIGSYTSAVQLCRNIGAALGINTVAALQIMACRQLGGTQQPTAWAQSFSHSFLLLAGLAALALICTWLMPNRATRQS
ncbi:MFS transporter [Burkholderiaceae bacterium DAT-1]|nr:MFS transporter [Burkholderiaceae bacterium DAT-1]